MTQRGKGHFHPDERGVLQRCYHTGTNWLRILAISFVGEVIMFYPTHELFQALGWL